MPTTAGTTYSGLRLDPYMDPEDALSYAVGLVQGTYAAGTVLGEVTATPGIFKAYASGSSDGSQIPKALLTYPVTVDASGNITVPGDIPSTRKDTPAYFAGTFKCSDLVGLDSGGLTAMGGRLISGVNTGTTNWSANAVIRLG